MAPVKMMILQAHQTLSRQKDRLFQIVTPEIKQWYITPSMVHPLVAEADNNPLINNDIHLF